MEITLLPQAGLRLKGKHATFIVDGSDKVDYNAVILLKKSLDEVTVPESTVVIQGPGDYEIGGIKISGLRSDAGVAYNLRIDNIEILLGSVRAIEKLQNKVKEGNILIALCDTTENTAPLASLASNVLIFYGEKAPELSKSVSNEGVKTMAKYSVTMDKIPAEMETILLATSV